MRSCLAAIFGAHYWEWWRSIFRSGFSANRGSIRPKAETAQPRHEAMWDFLNNASVGAFVGAFSAFLLVVATDLRRRYRYRTLLKYLISDNQDHAQKKLEAVRMNLALIREDNRVTPAPFMLFPTKSIKDYQFQVLDILNSNQKQALDALVYWMEAIDGLLSEATQNASELKRLVKENAATSERARVAGEYIDCLEEAEKNLGYFIKLSGYYVQGEPRKVVEFYHPIGGADGT